MGQAVSPDSRHTGASQVLRRLAAFARASCGAASESSPRREPWGRAWCPPRAAERRKNRSSHLLLSPLPGLRIHYALSHGSRRGLLSDATPWLPCRRVFLLKISAALCHALNLNSSTSPTCTTYSLPSMR